MKIKGLKECGILTIVFLARDSRSTEPPHSLGQCPREEHAEGCSEENFRTP